MADQASELLSGCERSAVHLEMRDTYSRNDPRFADWLGGFRYDPADRSSWWHPWLDTVERARARGVAVRRARIVSEPVSEYIRYEYDITFRNVAAGEQVRWLPRRQASDLALPGNDFWLFDDRLVLWLHFNGEGDLLPDGWETTEDPAAGKHCAAAFESVWERAIPHEDYQPA
jgi:hypothetical protein